MSANIPYKMVGGVNFYARREIKDLLSYLKTIDNAKGRSGSAPDHQCAEAGHRR
ncbi:MAG: 3'-5' exonuclease [Lachnospiraceae bacterium]